ncbi:DUF4886 domain-containing protein [Mangrovimonas sp. TPBH4]|uniref:DUF4886 domain-containing protein n=1 Tax=Mangrovimonas sp. TPBH4 TaxID=1645914 RepID=UPI000B24520A|nr:DUF4886 domain-containing protein [Mangrovimonas sp. TPBH4]
MYFILINNQPFQYFMKTTSLLICLLVSLAVQLQGDMSNEKLNVLFIGNSLTYFHDMPQTLQNMLNETHPNISIDQITFPGLSLTGHLSDIVTIRTENGIHTRKKEEGERTETEIKITSKNWDVIILQTGTVSVLIPENLDLKVSKAITDIQNMVSNPHFKFVLFYTWPSKKEYPKQYCYSSYHIDESIEKPKCCSKSLENPEQELSVINESYDVLANAHGLTKTDNGTKFLEVSNTHPEVELYDDSMHPNQYGAFLNACIFYQILTNQKATTLKYHGDIAPKTATLLKQIAG